MALESSLCLCPFRIAARTGFHLESRSIGKLMLFLVLSALDFLLTMQLVHQSDGWVYESNPLANWWLARGGWMGLALFKLGIVAGVTYAWLIIASWRPQLGDMVLSFACSSLVLVVLYSGALTGVLRAYPDEAGVENAQQVEAVGRSWDQRISASIQLREAQRRLGAELAAGSCSLYEAVGRLTAHPQCHDQVWLTMLGHTFPRLSSRQCLALSLVGRAFTTARTPEMDHLLRTQLTDDFAIPREEMLQVGLGQQ